MRLTHRLAVTALLVTMATTAKAAEIGVTTHLDTDLADGECSLREAIIAANTDIPYNGCSAGAGDDRIVIAAAGSVLLAADLPTVEENLEIVGPSGDSLWLDGNQTYSLLVIDSPTDDQHLELVDVGLRNGLSVTGGGGIHVAAGDSLSLDGVRVVENESEEEGGGVKAVGAAEIVIRESSIAANASRTAGGGLYLEDSPALIEDSVIGGNVAGTDTVATAGGGLLVHGSTVAIRRSTVSGNQAENGGGLIAILDASIRLEHSTVTDNLCDTVAHGAIGAGCGISVTSTTPTTVFNSVIAGNVEESTLSTTEPDVYCGSGATIASDGYNLVGVNDGCSGSFPPSPGAGLPNLNGDLVGTSLASVDPLLGSSAANGGPTRSHLPLAGSPLVDGGSCPGELRDQRGWGDPEAGIRVVDVAAATDTDDGCDIGAVERSAHDLSVIFDDGFEGGDTLAWSSTEGL